MLRIKLSVIFVILFGYFNYALASSELDEQCKNGDYAICGKLGYNYANGLGVYFQDIQKAIYYYELGCNGGNAWSCKNLDLYKKGADKVAKDPQETINLYEKQCYELSLSEGCLKLGNAYFLGEHNLALDEQKAINLYEKACKLNNSYELAAYCRDLGTLYENGHSYQQVTISPDMQKALEFYKIACQNFDPQACVNLQRIESNTK